MLCACGRPAHPCYGAKCEDCYVEASKAPGSQPHYDPFDLVGFQKTLREARHALLRDLDLWLVSVEKETECGRTI